jgi:uncharacterized protein YdhG (YjbR/CyaY superfamily)
MKLDSLYERLSSPARRALQALGLAKVEDLSRYSREAISGLHGVGPSAMEAIEAEMASARVGFLEEGGEAGAPARPGNSLIDDYIRQFPPETQSRLNEIRAAIRSAAPEATEKIAYQMPTFFLEGNLVHFAGYKNHIGFYPTPSGIAEFKEELDSYKNAKGSVQFPLDRPLPINLIKRIVKYRLEEKAKKAALAKKKRRT